MQNKSSAPVSRAREIKQTYYNKSSLLKRIPAELAETPHWVVWKMRSRANGKKDKIPYSVHTGKQCSINDPASYASIEIVLNYLEKNADWLSGIGFCLTQETGIVGLDLDNALDEEGRPRHWASEILGALPSTTYIEISPSGNGLRAFLRGHKKLGSKCSRKHADGKFEMYDSNRFLTITCNRYGEGMEVPIAQEVIDWLQEKWLDNAPDTIKDNIPAMAGNGLSDEEVLLRMFGSRNGEAIKRLYDGFDEAHEGDASVADQSLLCHLAYWTGGEPEQMERLFGDSARGQREKWRKRPDYRQRSIQKALKYTADSAKPAQPRIVVNQMPLSQQAQVFLKVLADSQYNSPRYFVYSGKLVEVDMTRAKIVEVGKDRMARLIQDLTRPISLTQNGERPAHNIGELVKYILAEPVKAGLPELKGLYDTPIVTPAFKLLKESGYDKESGLYVALPSNLSVKALEFPLPSTEAIAAFKDLYCDFTFQDERSGFAHVLAMAFTMILRPLIKGAIPGFAVLAAIPGTGKSLLVEVTTAIVRLEKPMFMSFPKDEDEMRKSLITSLKEGKTLILFDNTDKTVNSNVLEAFLTSSRYGGRLLGVNESGDYPNNALVVINGNNPDFSRAMARRVIPILLESPLENPHARSDFKYSNIKRHVLEERQGFYLNTLLSLILPWLNAGAPLSGHRLGSFEDWASIIGGILDYHGIPGFLQGLEFFQSRNDVETNSWESLVSAWYERYADSEVTPSQILDVAYSIESTAGLGFFAKSDYRGQQISLGKELQSKRNRIYGGLKIVHCGQHKGTKSQLYRLEPHAKLKSDKLAE